MKRVHLFEFEDFNWFPNSLRKCLTRYLVALHKVFGTSGELAGLIKRGLEHSTQAHIIDMCSGGGGPMLDVLEELRKEKGQEDIHLTMTDLYPNTDVAKEIAALEDKKINYLTTSVNAADVDAQYQGLRTMVCSMHHMTPTVAHNILKDAKEDKQPICVFELSDNSIPLWIAWTAFPFAAIMVFFLTPLVRPMTWQQLVFTYLFPILPLFIAWDGMVSNMRTYTMSDIDELLNGLQADDYQWERGTIKGKGGRRSYILGLPKTM